MRALYNEQIEAWSPLLHAQTLQWTGNITFERVARFVTRGA